ncbi:hypothetical protein F2Q69_00033123 [Brassica cretica]|uniref:GTD-binding domain-containing protein n=1 Tax=Brassica cretica TaxID=69181 RepID=A0A8S9SDZ4_BRACR|nr:hypothetical protein F2Q69_00033123 [Brassica cretica]
MGFTFSRFAAGNGGGSFKPILSAATCSGSLHVLMADLAEGAEIEEVYAAEGEGFHVESVDWRKGSGECVMIGDDESECGDGCEWAVKWASPSEFVTGGYGFGLQLWDQRKGGEAVSHKSPSLTRGEKRSARRPPLVPLELILGSIKVSVCNSPETFISLIQSTSSSIRDMLERSHSLRIHGAETLDLRLALYECKEVTERLQDELNAEREASATSASEALSMILRLQGEKAELAREAGQYKRIAQEEMSHAEMWFAHLEDFIHQKENVITALECQVDAYRSQLLSFGYSDLSSLDVKLQENDVRSQIPFPELVNDLSVPVEKEVIEESVDSQKSYFDVYWDHIKKMDEKVKEFKTEDALMMKVAMKTKMKKKSTKQTRDRSGKRDRAEYQAELQRLRQRVDQLERERTKTVPETSGVILKEMKEEVSCVHSSEVKRSNTMENLRPWIDPAIVSVQEAMLNFWL